MSAASRLFAALLAALVSGCIAVGPSTDELPLPEGAWELVRSNFIESGRLPGLPRPTLDLKDGRIAAYSGCNRASGAVRAESGRLAMPKLDITRRDCPEPVGVFDTRYFELLRGRPVYRVEGDTLRLIAGDYNALFRRR